MSVRATRPALAVLLGVALAAGATPATAQVRDFTDPATADPDVADVRSIRVDHATSRPGRLVVTVGLRRILPGDQLHLYVDTDPANAGPERLWAAAADSEYAARRLDRWAGPGRVFECAGDRVSLSAGRRQARVVLPRVCLGGADRVRVAIRATRGDTVDWAPRARSWYRFVRAGTDT